MEKKITFSPGSFFHGTKADLKVGDFLTKGFCPIMGTGGQNMFILQVLWMRLSGVRNWRPGRAGRGSMLWSPRGSLKMIPT